ncbi:hypothetical protein N9D92_01235 [Gammaproteobacteria bacterium]|nr:hypothetical protein [Gammaproteobacteria bacterium]MDC0892090.1 hypothetical protein [Gammaproteobacteria bacterium]
MNIKAIDEAIIGTTHSLQINKLAKIKYIPVVMMPTRENLPKIAARFEK